MIIPSKRPFAASQSWQAHSMCDNSPLKASQFTVSRRDARALSVLASHRPSSPPEMQPVPDPYSFEEAEEMNPDHINPIEWHQSLGIARQSCARVFRDGGMPADALAAFGLKSEGATPDLDWSRAVEIIAQSLCGQPMRRAA